MNFGKHVCRKEQLFSNDNEVAVRSDLQTLQPQSYLIVVVVNVWACHLNYQERLRS